MKKTILLMILICAVAIIFGTLGGFTTTKNKVSDDCCISFYIVNGAGEPVRGCKITLHDKDGGYAGECTTSETGTCSICGLIKEVWYTYTIDYCSCPGSVAGVQCGGPPVQILCQHN